MAGPNLRSALLVEVPEAEPLVRRWRMDLDPHAALGVPAHITVLFPFAPPPLISTTILDRLGELLTAVDAFNYNLIETGWFGDSVLWLAPDPPDPFRSLTRRIGDAFTDYPPYGGRFGEPVPAPDDRRWWPTRADEGCRNCGPSRSSDQRHRGVDKPAARTGNRAMAARRVVSSPKRHVRRAATPRPLKVTKTP